MKNPLSNPESRTVAQLLDRKYRSTFLLFVPFVVCIIGARAWFNFSIMHQTPQEPGVWLSACTNLPGYVFYEEPLSGSVKKSLGTTNILNGTFVKVGIVRDYGGTGDLMELESDFGENRRNFDSDLRPSSTEFEGQRVHVFLASWTAGNKKASEALLHSPDSCWEGGGWKSADLGEPNQITVALPYLPSSTAEVIRSLNPQSDLGANTSITSTSIHVPFHFRIFETLEGRRLEAAVWCALVDGQALTWTLGLDEGSLVDSSIVDYFWSRSSRVVQIVRDRRRLRGGTQFVRYSVSSDGNWVASAGILKPFGPHWLRATVF